MKRIVKISAQLALLLALSGAMSCESMLDEMAATITSLRQQYVALLMPKPLPEVAVTYAGHTISPGELIEMGTTYSDDTNTITLTITNIGTVPVNVTSITIKGWYADRFTVAGFTPTRLASNNDTTTFSVTFQGEPYDRYKAATVSIITADDEGDDYAPFNITVACERMEVMRGILAVRLGLLTVPDDYLYNMGPSTSRFTLKNIGTEVLSIKSVAHGDMDNFSVSGSVSETVIPVNGSVYIDVTFEPDDAGTYTDLITITYNDVPGGEDLTFDLNLCGYAEEVYSYEIDLLDTDTGVSRPSGYIHNFGGQDYGTQGEGKTFSITNSGTGILELTSIILADGNNFTLVPPTGMVVLPDDSVDFTVYYNPITAGTHQSAITIISNDPDETAYVLNLSGHSMQPSITMEPPPEGHDFFNMGADGDYNTVTGKQASPFRVFTVRNSGDGDLPLTITVPVLSGTGAGDFDLNTSGINTSLYAGESTTFSVRFDPLSTGLKTASIDIGSNDPDTPTCHTSVQGTGVVPEINVSISLKVIHTIYDNDDEDEFLEMYWDIQACVGATCHTISKRTDNDPSSALDGYNSYNYGTWWLEFFPPIGCTFSMPKFSTEGFDWNIYNADWDSGSSHECFSCTALTVGRTINIVYDQGSNRFTWAALPPEDDHPEITSIPFNTPTQVNYQSVHEVEGQVWMNFDFYPRDFTESDYNN